MTFKDIAIKNFRSNIKKYLSYFLCSSFSIMIFFMNATLLFNEKLKGKVDFDSMSYIFTISMAAVAIFSVFFINYAHSAFIKSRYKEFGIYITLGMTSKDLRRIVTIENSIVILASLFAGLVSGLIFSRLFQMIVIKLLALDNIGYTLNYKSLMLTLIVFLLIFAIVIAISSFETNKLEISQLLKKARKGEGKLNTNYLPGLIGIALLLLSFVILFVITSDKKLASNSIVVLIYLGVSFSSAYFIISGLGGTLFTLLKNSNYYYKNILFLTEINYKFNQNKKILFILTILSAVTVFFVASPIALYSQASNIAEKVQRNTIEYGEIGGFNNLPKEKLQAIIKASKTPFISQNQVEFISLNFNGSLTQSKPIISQEVYNSITSSKVSLPKGKALNIILNWVPGYNGIDPNAIISFNNGTQRFQFTILDSVHTDVMPWVTSDGVYAASSGIVLSDEDYESMKAGIKPESLGVFHLLNFKEWKKTSSTVKALDSALMKENNINPSIDKRMYNAFKTYSTIGARNDLKKGYSLFIFVTVVMGSLFFMASGSVLYFKQYTELSATKEKFYKLYKLGITENEATKIIAKELRITFFTPLLLGSILGFSLIFFMTNLLGGEKVLKDFMVNATLVILVYFLVQEIFYRITKCKNIKKILS